MTEFYFRNADAVVTGLDKDIKIQPGDPGAHLRETQDNKASLPTIFLPHRTTRGVDWVPCKLKLGRPVKRPFDAKCTFGIPERKIRLPPVALTPQPQVNRVVERSPQIVSRPAPQPNSSFDELVKPKPWKLSSVPSAAAPSTRRTRRAAGLTDSDDDEESHQLGASTETGKLSDTISKFEQRRALQRSVLEFNTSN